LSAGQSRPVTTASDCLDGFVADSSGAVIAQIDLNGGLNALFAQYFDFDLSLSELIVGAYFMSFLSGHILARIVSGLRKAG
jgi:hypothetical protein